MEVIYKYDLQLTDCQEIQMPINSHIISAQLQNGSLKIWAIVDLESPIVKIKIHILGTGFPLPLIEGTFLKHISSIQQEGFVWHIFEEQV